MKKCFIIALAMAAIVAFMPFAVLNVQANEVDLAILEERIRQLEELEARIFGQDQLPGMVQQTPNLWTPRFGSWEEMQQWRMENGWGGWCWRNIDGTWSDTWQGPGGCWRFNQGSGWNQGMSGNFNNTGWNPGMGGRGMMGRMW
ncbi:MAG: hypothetical protein FWG65_07770 [Turicibacter sp.]|nr:hypothetical protein [Turicibacter sp.]